MQDPKDKEKTTMRRPHRKSRNGCSNCKRRRVKCDEQHPQCSQCIHFKIRCTFAPRLVSSSSETSASPASDSLSKRGRGRPRRDWLYEDTEQESSASELCCRSIYVSNTHINLDDAQLLLHFTQHTAGSINGNDAAIDRLFRFWSYNVPRIGLTHPFVMHMVYAFSAHHKTYLTALDHPAQRQKFKELAKHHTSLGLPQLTSALAHIDSANCGAAYIAATLVCYSSFAAGPAGPSDLLACNLDAEQGVLWVPMVHGVRLIRAKFDDDELFAGLMEPMHRRNFELSPETLLPRCISERLKRLDWEKALQALRDMVSLQRSDDAAVCLSELDKLISIYEATFGTDQDGSFHGPSENQFVFGWLYRLERPFICCLQQRDSIALVILSYFAVLLKTMEQLWYIRGWADHLVAMVKRLAHETDLVWLQWPSEALSYYDRA
ncbi:hypothetical protein F4679DRAFT_288443 [Xylaria curta]|nr:hypothetical protein F4679DRAFT_288443 [Xylaria curta]